MRRVAGGCRASGRGIRCGLRQEPWRVMGTVGIARAFRFDIFASAIIVPPRTECWSLIRRRCGGNRAIATPACNAWRNVFWSPTLTRGRGRKYPGLLRVEAKLIRKSSDKNCRGNTTTRTRMDDHERSELDAEAGEGFAIGDGGNCSAQRC